MDDKRLSEIEVILDECETTNELRRVMGSTGPLRELVAEIRKLREALAFYGDKKNYSSGIPFHESGPTASVPNATWSRNADNGYSARRALGLEPAPETEER